MDSYHEGVNQAGKECIQLCCKCFGKGQFSHSLHLQRNIYMTTMIKTRNSGRFFSFLQDDTSTKTVLSYSVICRILYFVLCYECTILCFSRLLPILIRICATDMFSEPPLRLKPGNHRRPQLFQSICATSGETRSCLRYPSHTQWRQTYLATPHPPQHRCTLIPTETQHPSL